MNNLNLIQPVNFNERLNHELRAWWLNTPQGRGGLTVHDLTRKGHDGKMAGSQDQSDWFGPRNRPGGFGSLHLDGVESTGDRVAIPHSDKLSFAGSFSIQCWFDPSGLPDAGRWAGLISKGGAGEGDGTDHNYILMHENGVFGSGHALTFLFENSDGDNQICRFGVTTTLNVWSHLCGVFDTIANTMRLYLNGAEVAETTSVTAVPNENTKQVFLGRNRDHTASLFHFNGYLDDWRIWARALSPNDVRAVYFDSRTGYKKTLNFINNGSLFLRETPVLAGTNRRFSIFDSPFHARTFRSGIFE